MGTQLVVEDDEVRRFFGISGEILCVIGFDGTIRKVSSAWTATLGFSQEELLSRPVVDFAHPKDRALISGAVQKLLDGAETASFECRFANKAGEYRRFFCNVTASPSKQLIYAAAR